MNPPIARHTEAFRAHSEARACVERQFAHQHRQVPDPAYRRRHLWQVAMAMHTLGRHATLLSAAHARDVAAQWRLLTGMARPEREKVAAQRRVACATTAQPKPHTLRPRRGK